MQFYILINVKIRKKLIKRKENENGTASLLMAKETELEDSTTRPHSHIMVLLRFYIVKMQHMYFYYILFYFRFFDIAS